jgi:hypothetical protein
MKRCSRCKKEKSENEFIWSKTNKEYSACSTCKDYIHQMERSIPSGVYMIRENGIPIYVGESDIPYRRRKEHFSKYKDWKSVKYKSEVSKAIFRNELEPSNLTFEMLHENIDSGIKHSQIRKELENVEIQKYNPKYNL